jgi:hypothetical protein
MAYKGLLNSQVRKAFILMKDLMSDVTFVQKQSPSFDFNADASVLTPPTTVTVKGYLAPRKKKPGAEVVLGVEQALLICKSADVKGVTAFDKITVNGSVWSFDSVQSDNGFTVELNISRGAYG